MDCWSTPSSLRSSLPWPCKLFSTFSDQFFTIIQIPLLSHSESPKKTEQPCLMFLSFASEDCYPILYSWPGSFMCTYLGDSLTDWVMIRLTRQCADIISDNLQVLYTSKSEVLWDSDKWEVRNIDIDSNINIDQDREGDFSANFHLTHDLCAHSSVNSLKIGKRNKTETKVN